MQSRSWTRPCAETTKVVPVPCRNDEPGEAKPVAVLCRNDEPGEAKPVAVLCRNGACRQGRSQSDDDADVGEGEAGRDGNCDAGRRPEQGWRRPREPISVEKSICFSALSLFLAIGPHDPLSIIFSYIFLAAPFFLQGLDSTAQGHEHGQHRASSAQAGPNHLLFPSDFSKSITAGRVTALATCSEAGKCGRSEDGAQPQVWARTRAARASPWSGAADRRHADVRRRG